MRLAEHFIPDSDLARLDAAAADIDTVWQRLAQQGYALPCLFFEFFRQCDAGEFDVDSRRLYYRECVREMFTCQFAQWMPAIRRQLHLYYRSAQLDGLDDDGVAGSAPAQHLRRVVARYDRFFQSAAEADRLLFHAYIEAMSLLKQQEMARLFSQRPELLDLGAESFAAVKRSMTQLLAGSGFTHDLRRSKRGVHAFSLQLVSGETDLVFSVAGSKPFDAVWRCEIGVVKRTMQQAFAAPASLYPDFPVMLDLSQLIPQSYRYLQHDNDHRAMRFGLVFLATAMTVLGAHLNAHGQG
ncbi:hypothetical protein [Rugamonas aquatica]|uniref:Uncharacterized protein n=1 Tax=Rugamonas aquatica TaxID=2743357 RepID=A0A6A7N9S6_9BURK|nr:hypothetical protein [Rugamonas aquatica]MQA41678.1 hypothetical protein [Rugamonas aquatica]